MNRVLIIAFHFPPFAGSSGVQRTLRFAQYLPEYGWDPVVLVPHPRAYERTDLSLLAALPGGLPVETAFCVDAARHLSIFRRYPAWLARPDRWMSWRYGGITKGLSVIRRYRPSAIWSTYPIATAHLIGASLQRLSKLPWIADFRDPMAQPNYPKDPKTWQSFLRTEQAVLRGAACWTFTTPGAARFYSARYPVLSETGRSVLIENGYDEESFASLPAFACGKRPETRDPLILLHSGVVYPDERDPRGLMRGLHILNEKSPGLAQRLKIRFRASSHDGIIAHLAGDHRVEHMIEFAPAIPYADALREMMSADALVVLQAANCNDQIPAKLYEYMRAGRPILALTDPRGDTADLVRRAGMSYLAPLDSPEEIAATLQRLCEDLLGSRATTPTPGFAEQFSRRKQTGQLAEILNRIRAHGPR